MKEKWFHKVKHETIEIEGKAPLMVSVFIDSRYSPEKEDHDYFLSGGISIDLTKKNHFFGNVNTIKEIKKPIDKKFLEDEEKLEEEMNSFLAELKKMAPEVAKNVGYGDWMLQEE